MNRPAAPSPRGGVLVGQGRSPLLWARAEGPGWVLGDSGNTGEPGPTGQGPGAPGQVATRGPRAATQLGPTGPSWGAGLLAGSPPGQILAILGPPGLRALRTQAAGKPSPLQTSGSPDASGEGCERVGSTARSPRPLLPSARPSLPGRPACETLRESWPRLVSEGGSAPRGPRGGSWKG